VAATAAYRTDLQLSDAGHLKWYRSSETAERGFCSDCGGNLFWRRDNSDTISIFAGTLDQPSGLSLTEHICVADKADYYEITDGLPQQASAEINARIKEA